MQKIIYWFVGLGLFVLIGIKLNLERERRFSDLQELNNTKIVKNEYHIQKEENQELSDEQDFIGELLYKEALKYKENNVTQSQKLFYYACKQKHWLSCENITDEIYKKGKIYKRYRILKALEKSDINLSNFQPIAI